MLFAAFFITACRCRYALMPPLSRHVAFACLAEASALFFTRCRRH